MLGDGLGMGAADYLGTKSDDEYMTQEENRERKEIENDFEAEKEEMIHIYNEMGLEKAVSNEIVDILSKNKEGFLKIMMIEELQLLAGGENPFTNSVVTFISFVLFGFTPLIPTLIAHAQGLVHMGRECVVQRQELLLSLGIERSHHAFMNIPIEPRSRALTGVMPGALVHVHRTIQPPPDIC